MSLPEEVKREALADEMAYPQNDIHRSPPSFCIVVPTYNNQLTIGDVIKDILKVTPDLIVVNDGSTDGADKVLSAIPRITVITHEHNVGKGAALLSGLRFAARSNYNYMITMDGDGQHLAVDLPKFLEEMENHPDALIIGRRNLTGGGKRLKSRLLRAHSNFWVWVLTQKWAGDSQCGFRVYPVASILELPLRKRKYDFEIEVLVIALWAGTQIREVPIAVNYVPGSKSHFRPFRDFMLVSVLIISLLFQKIIQKMPCAYGKGTGRNT